MEAGYLGLETSVQNIPRNLFNTSAFNTTIPIKKFTKSNRIKLGYDVQNKTYICIITETPDDF